MDQNLLSKLATMPDQVGFIRTLLETECATEEQVCKLQDTLYQHCTGETCFVLERPLSSEDPEQVLREIAKITAATEVVHVQLRNLKKFSYIWLHVPLNARWEQQLIQQVHEALDELSAQEWKLRQHLIELQAAKEANIFEGTFDRARAINRRHLRTQARNTMERDIEQANANLERECQSRGDDEKTSEGDP